jgi:cell division protein FtsB
MNAQDLLRKPIRRRQPRTWLTWGLAFVTTVILVDAVFGDEGVVARVRARAEYDRHLAHLQALRQENLTLQERQRRLRDDRGAVEEAARRDLGFIRRGEILFLIRPARSRP